MDTLTFLLVDDSPAYRHILHDVVGREERWLIVDEADDGPAALELAAALAPDVVLMDVQLPTMSGFAVTRQLRRMTQQPLIILFSGHHDEEYDDASWRAGANFYLRKERVDNRTLAALVNSHFATQGYINA